jgi:hypothetical protein
MGVGIMTGCNGTISVCFFFWLSVETVLRGEEREEVKEWKESLYVVVLSRSLVIAVGKLQQ